MGKAWKDVGHPEQYSFEWPEFRLHNLMQTIIEEHFPKMPERPTIMYGKLPTLASLTSRENSYSICISSLLNRTDTPREVIEHMIKHELIHILVPPKDIDGKRISHPPEFWELEKKVSPDSSSAWKWLDLALHGDAKKLPKEERIHVYKKAYKAKPSPVPTYVEAKEAEFIPCCLI